MEENGVNDRKKEPPFIHVIIFSPLIVWDWYDSVSSVLVHVDNNNSTQITTDNKAHKTKVITL
jgi:hypothetical protein